MRRLVFFLLACMSPYILAAENLKSIIVELRPPESQQDKQAADEIRKSGVNQTIIQLSQAHFPFKHPLTIYYGSSDGPLYAPDEHTVYIPYSFYIESKHYFEKNDYQKKYGRTAQQGAIDTLLHTLLHEAGHAYVADQNIAILGKEEDAVDNFATVVLLNYVDSGDDVAISAADMFAFESDDRPDYYEIEEYIGEHSFDLQRYFATLCLVYGSNPEKHHELLNEVDDLYREERQEACAFTYDEIDQNWHQYLRQ